MCAASAMVKILDKRDHSHDRPPHLKPSPLPHPLPDPHHHLSPNKESYLNKPPHQKTFLAPLSSIIRGGLLFSEKPHASVPQISPPPPPPPFSRLPLYAVLSAVGDVAVNRRSFEPLAFMPQIPTILLPSQVSLAPPSLRPSLTVL